MIFNVLYLEQKHTMIYFTFYHTFYFALNVTKI